MNGAIITQTMRSASSVFQRMRDSAPSAPVLLEVLPRLARDDVAVDLGQQLPRALDRALERELVHVPQVLRHDRLRPCRAGR